jgi:hypothetical protein
MSSSNIIVNEEKSSSSSKANPVTPKRDSSNTKANLELTPGSSITKQYVDEVMSDIDTRIAARKKELSEMLSRTRSGPKKKLKRNNVSQMHDVIPLEELTLLYI